MDQFRSAVTSQRRTADERDLLTGVATIVTPVHEGSNDTYAVTLTTGIADVAA